MTNVEMTLMLVLTAPGGRGKREVVPFGPICIEKGELEAKYSKTKDWETVYASYNID